MKLLGYGNNGRWKKAGVVKIGLGLGTKKSVGYIEPEG
jgi:hypothetical protein